MDTFGLDAPIGRRMLSALLAAQSFVIGCIGSSNAAGHDANYSAAFPNTVGRLLDGAFRKLNFRDFKRSRAASRGSRRRTPQWKRAAPPSPPVVVRNRAAGAHGPIQQVLCLQSKKKNKTCCSSKLHCVHFKTLYFQH